MPSFTNSLIRLGPFVDTGHTVVFTATGVLVIHPDGHSILDGWREARLRNTCNYAVITLISAFWKVDFRLRKFYYAVIEFL